MSLFSSKVHANQDGSKISVESGGSIDIESGGSITADGTQASAITDLTITYTTGDPSITPNGALTVADGSTPTVAELLEAVEELTSIVNSQNAALRGAGIIASS